MEMDGDRVQRNKLMAMHIVKDKSGSQFPVTNTYLDRGLEK